MAIDPTGYDKALAQIQPGALSERKQRIAVALGMIRDGSSLKNAARVAKVPYSTLWEYQHAQRSLSDPEGRGERDMATVQAFSVDMSLMAAENVIDSLTNERDQWKPGDLIKLYGVATDKLIAMGQRSNAADDSVSELAKLLANSRVTVEPKPADSGALEVDAQRIG